MNRCECMFIFGSVDVHIRLMFFGSVDVHIRFIIGFCGMLQEDKADLTSHAGSEATAVAATAALKVWSHPPWQLRPVSPAA